MPVISVGVDHEHAEMELLEAVTVAEADLHKVAAGLRALEDLDEFVVLSTCLRIEVYAVIERFHGAVDGITSVLAERVGRNTDELTGSISVHFDRGVPAHLFAVASGLRSAVPGETEVLGQVRRALERAEELGTVGPELRELFRHALSAGRRARAETAIARGTTSFAHAAVDLVTARLGSLADRHVLVVGAGQLAEGILEALDDLGSASPAGLVIANRTAPAAQRLATGHDHARGTGLDELGDELETADVLVAAVEADGHLVTASMLRDRTRPLLAVDLSMPRVVDAAAGELEHVELLDLAHLRGIVDTALRERHEELTAAEAIVDEEVARHLEARRARGAAPLITAFRSMLDELRTAELERASSDLRGLTDEQRERIDQLTRALVAKVAHGPTAVLREVAGSDRGERLSEALRQLFGL